MQLFVQEVYKDPNRPIGSFIFLGPTGVGKTEVARSLAYELFDDEHHMVRIDMRVYGKNIQYLDLLVQHQVMLVMKKEDKLTEKVRRNPYSIVLLMKQKKHPDVLNLLVYKFLMKEDLLILMVVPVDFKNTIIIMMIKCWK